MSARPIDPVLADVQGVQGKATRESDLTAAELLLLAVKAADPAEHDRLMALRSEKIAKEA